MKGFLAKIFRGKERRKFKRFIVNEVTPIFLDHPAAVEAAVENISLDGICIRYASESQIVSEKQFDLDVRASDGFHLGKIAVARISEAKLRPMENDSRTFWRLRGRFIAISDVQKLKLQRFLEGYERKFASD